MTVLLHNDSILSNRTSRGSFIEKNIRMSRFDFFLKSGRALIYPIYKGIFERGGDLTA